MFNFFIFELNVLFYFLFPFSVCLSYRQNRVGALYVYLGVVLLWGGLAGSIYSFKLFDSIVISGGNLAYGAFMMTAVLLILTERNRSTFYKIIRILIGIDILVFLGFALLVYVLKNGIALNPMSVSYELFEVSFWGLVVGGILIFAETMLLYLLFIRIGSKIKNITVLSVLYVGAYMAALILDGILFPVLGFGIRRDLLHIIVGGLPGKAVLGVCFGVPLMLYLLLNKNDVKNFTTMNLKLKDIVNFKYDRLIEEIYRYERNSEAQLRQIEKMRDISGTDQLTGIPNRRRFEEHLNSEWMRAQRGRNRMTLVIADVDFFKLYNDFYGHAQGDVCLRQVAGLWSETARRPSDLAARIGGEEFALIYPETDPEDIIESLKDFQDKLSQAAIEHNKSPVSPAVTMSLGVASCLPRPGMSPIELFKLADKKLYEAKETGRNKIVLGSTVEVGV